MTNPMQFPDGFVFGGATAAYQVEGETRTHGKGKVPWDDFLAAQGRFSPDPASDFYNQYPVDIDLCQRFGLAWPDHALLMQLQRCARPAIGKLLQRHRQAAPAEQPPTALQMG